MTLANHEKPVRGGRGARRVAEPVEVEELEIRHPRNGHDV